MANRDKVALSIGEVIMEGALLEHAIAELCWTLVWAGAHADEEAARVTTENMQYEALKDTTVRLARLCHRRGQLQEGSFENLKRTLQETVEPMKDRGAIAHVVVFGSGDQHMGFRRKGQERFSPIDPVQLLELSGQLAQLSARISIMHGDIKRQMGTPLR